MFDLVLNSSEYYIYYSEIFEGGLGGVIVINDLLLRRIHPKVNTIEKQINDVIYNI